MSTSLHEIQNSVQKQKYCHSQSGFNHKQSIYLGILLRLWDSSANIVLSIY